MIALARPDFLAIDTEGTGIHIRHGCRPFFVAACDQDGATEYWEWDIDPFTRKPRVPVKDIQEIRRRIKGRRTVFHHAKYDIRSLSSVGVKWSPQQWDTTDDTLLYAHLLASSGFLKLKELALDVLDIPLDDQEELKEGINRIRPEARSLGWRIAKETEETLPGGQEPDDGWWVLDMWLPRAWAQYKKLPSKHPYWSLCKRYCCRDAERTAGLYVVMQREVQERHFEELYEQRRLLLRNTYEMEDNGITFCGENLQKARTFHIRETEKYREKVEIYSRGVVENPASPKQVVKAIEELDIPPIMYTKKGEISTKKECIEEWLQTLPANTIQHRFIQNLFFHRKHEKAVQYSRSYEVFGVQYDPAGLGGSPPRGVPSTTTWMDPEGTWWKLHPSFNITGTATTRFSSSGPNAQQISKQELINLRRVFGPGPGRRWYSADFDNIELRIFAFKSGDEAMINAFRQGKSVHLIICKLLFPKEYAACERDKVSFKDRYKASLYQYVKNGNFSLIYGAGPAKADATYHFKGAYELIRSSMPQIDSFMAEKYHEGVNIGYVTLDCGYRLDTPADRPHVAVNYYVQGSAGWCMVLAVNRVSEYLRKVSQETGKSYRLIMTVHDELVFDFPDEPESEIVAIQCARIMEGTGAFMDVPTTVSLEYHAETWAKGEHVPLATSA